ncbi:MAG: hypothetical protein ABL952_06955 [Pyrinomonadaceae bacterium]
MSLRRSLGLLLLVLLSLQDSFSQKTEAASAEHSQGLVFVKEFSKSGMVDLSDEGSLLILYTREGHYDPIMKTGFYERVLDWQTEKELDRLIWDGDVGGVSFLPDSRKVLQKNSLVQVPNLRETEIPIRDIGKRHTQKCRIPFEFKAAYISGILSDKAILTFSDERSTPAPTEIFLLDLNNCQLIRGGTIELAPQYNNVRMMRVNDILTDRYVVFDVWVLKKPQVFVIWDLKTAKTLKVIVPPTGSWTGGFTRDGKYLYVRGGFDGDNRIQFYDTSNYGLAFEKSLPTQYGDVDFSHDGKYMALSYYDIQKGRSSATTQPMILIYDIKSWTEVASIKYKKRKKDYADAAAHPSVRFTPDGKHLIASGPTSTAVWRLQLP